MRRSDAIDQATILILFLIVVGAHLHFWHLVRKVAKSEGALRPWKQGSLKFIQTRDARYLSAAFAGLPNIFPSQNDSDPDLGNKWRLRYLGEEKEAM